MPGNRVPWRTDVAAAVEAIGPADVSWPDDGIKDLGFLTIGRFDPANPGRIELDTGRANEFETDAYGAGSDNTSANRRVFIVGTTLLHELCHWGNFMHGVTETEEAGIAFEVATYGRNTG